MKMKRIITIALLATTTFALISCKKFLNVTPIEAQSGNNFWKTQQDVEDFTNGIYARIRTKIGGRPEFFRRFDKMFFPALEIRNNNVNIRNIDNRSDATPLFNALINNNMRVVQNTPNKTANWTSPNYAGLTRDIMSWKEWYDVIAAANILYQEVDNVPADALAANVRARYKAEAVFLRNLSYMFICKLFGDAIYYTDAYHTASLPRTPQVQVMNRCIEDMMKHVADLPDVYADPSSKGFRPTKVAAIALLMHLNMWAAGFDTGDKTKYYNAVKQLGTEMASFPNYRILNISDATNKEVFKGRSDANIFGILQDNTINEGFSMSANFSYFFARFPFNGRQQNETQSYMFYDKAFIEKVFPPGIADVRIGTWFENYNAGNGTFQLKKFANVVSEGTGVEEFVRSDDSAIIFRVADCYLLVAEALAELADEGSARSYLNQVRSAAGAQAINSSGDVLKEDIYYERCRELIGEGHFFFDAVRTRRITNTKYVRNPMSVANLNSGAWTWPLTISATEQTANPFLVGNNFWN
jgi:starch-binding outer membrane protein, SusD/RagB family